MTTREELQATLLRLLSEIAPEIDPAAIDPHTSLRDQIDLDSMNFLDFLISVDEALHIAIPERDYGRLQTLDGCLTYLMEHTTGQTNQSAAPHAAG